MGFDERVDRAAPEVSVVQQSRHVLLCFDFVHELVHQLHYLLLPLHEKGGLDGEALAKDLEDFPREETGLDGIAGEGEGRVGEAETAHEGGSGKLTELAHEPQLDFPVEPTTQTLFECGPELFSLFLGRTREEDSHDAAMFAGEKVSEGEVVGGDGELEVVEVKREARRFRKHSQELLGFFGIETELVAKRKVLESLPDFLLLEEGSHLSEEPQAEAFSVDEFGDDASVESGTSPSAF